VRLRCLKNGVSHTEGGGLSHTAYAGLSHTDYVAREAPFGGFIIGSFIISLWGRAEPYVRNVLGGLLGGRTQKSGSWQIVCDKLFVPLQRSPLGDALLGVERGAQLDIYRLEI